MILGAMTIAMLLALILFTSLFSDSFPRNFTRYLETKIATFSLDYKCNYMWRFSVWSLRTRNFDLQSQYTWSEIHFSLCQSRLECEELITITNISHMDTLWKRDWEELQHLATLVLHGINKSEFKAFSELLISKCRSRWGSMSPRLSWITGRTLADKDQSSYQTRWRRNACQSIGTPWNQMGSETIHIELNTSKNDENRKRSPLSNAITNDWLVKCTNGRD